MDGGIQMIEEALKVDPKCEFAYETLAAFEIQKYGNNLSGTMDYCYR
jgi:hypothetical protein